MRPASIFALVPALLALAMAGCPNTTGDLPDDGSPVRLLSAGPGIVLPGSRLVVTGEGFRSEPMKLSLRGDVVGANTQAKLDVQLIAEAQSGTEITALVTDEVFAAAGGEGEFDGKLWLEVTRDGRTWRSTVALRMTLARSLTPKLDVPSTMVVYLGDAVPLEGEKFLLGGYEGRLELTIEGEFTPDGGGAAESIAPFVLPVTVESRERATYLHGTELFGLRTGEFRGTLSARNVHDGGDTIEGPTVDLEVLVLPSSIASLSPGSASRQQRVALTGNGFFASTREDVETVLELKGTFSPTAGGRENLDLELPVRVESGSHATWVLQPRVDEDQLVGFGSAPGAFTGTITPILFQGRNALRGEAWRGTFTVLPARQVVHVKFVPGFTEALRLYGLRNLESRVRERIIEVAERDYAGFRVEFRTEAPDDFEQWTTVELTGEDPNEVGLFGLDNTEGKDVGNVRLNDYVGGTNAAQGAIGAFAYGGVFLASFLRFSPKLCRVANDDGTTTFKRCPESGFAMASPRFDDVFGAFTPVLGGTEARVDEWDAGNRRDAVREAVRVLGSLAGNTLSHELGHSLGLAIEIGVGDEFHNPGDLPGLLMNPGSSRTFEERGALDGQGPGVWSDGDRAYLEEILGG